MEGVKIVLLDIEGTVCSISFVKDVLFPYAINALPDVLAKKWDAPEFQPYRDAFPVQYQQDPNALQAHVEDLTKRDVKIFYLKNLQGFLWEEGYKTGAYATSLFSDVVPALQRWKDSGYTLAIYSSGSVFAQKLLFAHVQIPNDTNTAHKRSRLDDGDKAPQVTDLTGMFDGWFDTTNAGLKTESSSYAKIAEALKCNPTEVLFLSDNVKEVDAAIEVGMKSLVVDRPGNAPLPDDTKNRFQIVTALDQIDLSSMKNNQ